MSLFCIVSAFLVATAYANDPKGRNVEGTVTFYAEDHFDTNQHFKFGVVEDNASGERVFFKPSSTTQHLKTGDTVSIYVQNSDTHRLPAQPRLKGSKLSGPTAFAAGDQFSIVEKVELVSTSERRTRKARRSTVVTEERSILLMDIIHNLSNPNSWCDASCQLRSWWNSSLNINDAFYETSYGRIRFPKEKTHAVTVVLNMNASEIEDCDAGLMKEQALNATIDMLNASVVNAYDHWVFYIPDEVEGCDWGGLGSVGGGSIWLRSSGALIAAHEMAHNLGLNHASSDYDDDTDIDEEYGDVTCLVGGPSEWSGCNAPHKEQLGWLPEESVLTLDVQDVWGPCDEYTADGEYQYPSHGYRGFHNTTILGDTCQEWASQTPHTHDRTPEEYPGTGLDGEGNNYCRDPDGEGAPWCYTTNPDERWEYCDVINCAEYTFVKNNCKVFANMTLLGLGYTPNATEGYSTIRFIRERGGYYYLSFRPAAGVYDASMPKYLLNSVFLHYQETRTGNTRLVAWLNVGDEWRDKESGFRVQFHSSECPELRTALISVDMCPSSWPTLGSEFDECHSESLPIEARWYRGTVATTACGTPCIAWPKDDVDDYSNSGVSGDHNYCRNPDGSSAPWCRTNDGWGYCSVCGANLSCPPVFESTCDCSNNPVLGENYRGPLNVTVEGYTCQRWDETTPHDHDYFEDYGLGAGLDGNACRNPGAEEPRPWCYTTDPDKRWDFCDTCNEPPETFLQPPPPPPATDPIGCWMGQMRASSYRGKINYTKTGVPCQAWVSTTPHDHSLTPDNYPGAGLESNYCRDPDGEGTPWCYTTDPDERWDYCAVSLDETFDVTPEWVVMTQPEDGSSVKSIAVTSCYEYNDDAVTALTHLRNQNFDLMLELGDNIYSDTTNVCSQQRYYAMKRTNKEYDELLRSQIAVMATWDDHDFCYNNKGDDCDPDFRNESQKNFLTHYGVPKSDPRWTGDRYGVYDAKMFGSAETKDRVHVILLDARTARSPTYNDERRHARDARRRMANGFAPGECQGEASQMMDEDQWKWLEEELNKAAEVTVIGSGIQVLPPLASVDDVSLTDYCAYGENGARLMEARREMGEYGENEEDVCPPTSVFGGHTNCTARGTFYESWAEIGWERARLLKLAQKAINANKTKAVVFVSGDQHWAELGAKTIPYTEDGGKPQTVYELTGSGLAQSWDSSSDMYNDNRFPVNKCDHQGDSEFVHTCVTECTMDNYNVPWCYYEVNDGDKWGRCSNFVNVAPANYGEVAFDFAQNKVYLRIRLPNNTPDVAQEVTINLAPGNLDEDDTGINQCMTARGRRSFITESTCQNNNN
eukprot:m.326228 g.326228  ORF g.326228 m.326228 type:complete len:1326 (-) comp16556_c0_seq18:1721-5698(-)